MEAGFIDFPEIHSLDQDARRRIDELLEAELKYRTLISQSPDGILIIGIDGTILQFNATAHLQLDYSREEFRKLRISDIDPFQTPEQIRSSIRNVLKEGIATFEVMHQTKGGEIRNVKVITQVIDLSGQTAFHTIWRDITEEKQTKELLREAAVKAEEEKKRSHALVAAIGDGICIINTDFVILYQNDLHKEIAGDCEGQKCFKSLHDSDSACSGCPIGPNPRDENVVTAEKCIETERGNAYLEITATPLKDSRGEIVAVIEVARDVTERRKADTNGQKPPRDLRDELAKFGMLNGLLPICSLCKKIRDEEGQWKKLETYICEHSGVHFSHGICPDCAQEFYPEYYKK